MSDSGQVAVAPPMVKVKEKPSDAKPKRQPPYHVLLHNDDDHTYEYVILMLKELFGYSEEQGFKLAEQVDKTGVAIVATTTLERAELKRDQIHAYGKDKRLARCKGSMRSTIEPAAE